MEQINRITEMEKILNAAVSAFEREDVPLIRELQKDIERLAEYYHGPLWMQDFFDDRAGRIPKDLPRGVLTEDAVWDLLIDNDRFLKNGEINHG